MNICFVAPRFPVPPTKGDKLRVYQAIRRLSRRHRITLVAAADEPLDSDGVAELRALCERVEIVPISRPRSIASVALHGPFSRRPFQTHFYDSARFRRSVAEVVRDGRFDVIHASLLRVLPYLWDVVEPPVVVDLVDALSRSITLRRATVSPMLRFAYDLELKRVERYERAACERFERIIVCAEADRQALGDDNVVVLKTCADFEQFPFAPIGHEDDLVVMTGNMGYRPNVEAVVWFCREIWPLIRSQRSTARFRIVGTRPASAVRALDGVDGIEVTGPADIAQELRRATVSVCPTRVGSGMQTKVVEAMASGTPIVMTSFGNEGIGATDGDQITIADTPDLFAARVLELLGDPERRGRLAAAARRFCETEFSWDVHVGRLESLYESVVEARRGAQLAADLATGCG